MRTLARVVVDTNVLVSRLILPRSVPAQAVRKAEMEARLLISEATLFELADVLSRPKLNRYVSREDRKGFLRRLGNIGEFIPVVQLVRECRDLKDDMFLELALNGRANTIVTGDKDLLRMHPWRGIEIVSPTDYSGR